MCAGAKPEHGAPGGAGGGIAGGGGAGGAGGMGGADGGSGGGGGGEGGGWGGEGGAGGHGGADGGNGGAGGSGGMGLGEGWRGGAGGEGGGSGSAGGSGQLSRLVWSKVAVEGRDPACEDQGLHGAAGLRVRAVCGLPGEQAGHSPSTYCSHSSLCTASSGNANSELLQALRACSHASRHTPSGAPKAQPSMYDAHMKLLSASMHERPSHQAGIGSICLPTSAS